MIQAVRWFALILISAIVLQAQETQLKLATNDQQLDRAFVIALDDIRGNFHLYQAGLLDSPQLVMMAGAGYDAPWTRDAAINTWNGAGLLWPDIARNTLLSVLEQKQGKLMIGGQYWDAILWTTGVWNYYLYTGDKSFLSEAFSAAVNTLEQREADEFDLAHGLFRGPAVYGDGVAAYPDRYTKTGESNAILDWPQHNPQARSSTGFGLPMMTLSTNCAYLHSYELLIKMSKVLDRPADPTWAQKAEKLRTAIEQNFWKEDLGRYVTLIDFAGIDDRQEAIGLAFSVLFHVASPEHRESVFRHVALTPAGMPVLWPAYSRYSARGGFGRHSGTVWPHAQSLWADAAAQYGHVDLFYYELTRMAEKATRDRQFYEVYDPISGMPDGGLQERRGNEIVAWDSQPHQTWSASGYLRLILFDLLGMRFDEKGIMFSPVLPQDIDDVTLSGIRYRAAVLNIHVHGSGSRIAGMKINGRRSMDHRLSVTASGAQRIEISISK